eukprot:CAMPEP_0182458912 /NCGR_PEP_ID=MMETSP1319-20130603/4150_1 /TAXON_ID=172717 /ORGANISM="Bolidomonas pacifica, Strain RCC208" /LENGTH=101 /DNA_ID=CAMNT_0024657697 /DNA_START=9 /DNA_END=310 /DNA_ORIENTATION=-
MATLLNRSLRVGAQCARPLSRQMSEMSAEAAHNKVTFWTKTSYGMAVAVGALTVWNVYVHMSHGHHEHDEDAPLPAYMKIRTKPFPWEFDDCSPMDLKCKR